MAVAYHYTIGYFTRRDLEARKNVLSEGFSPLPKLVHLNRLTNPFGGTHIYKVGRQIVCGDRSLATLGSQNYGDDSTGAVKNDGASAEKVVALLAFHSSPSRV
jgi:hypothetical protein